MATSMPLTPPPSYAPCLIRLHNVDNAQVPAGISEFKICTVGGTATSRSTSAGSSSPVSSLGRPDETSSPPPSPNENNAPASPPPRHVANLQDLEDCSFTSPFPPCHIADVQDLWNCQLTGPATTLTVGLPPGLEEYAMSKIPPPPGLEDQVPPRPAVASPWAAPPGLGCDGAPPPPPKMPPVVPPPVFAAPEVLTVENQRFLDGPPGTLASITGTANTTSAGSEGHGHGTCKPCVFVHKQGCERGPACPFCHLCDAGEVSRRRKAKRAVRTAMKSGSEEW